MTAIPSSNSRSVFVEVGLTALRDEEGNFLPAVPLFIQVPASEINKAGQSPGEEALTESISQILAEKFGQYVQGVRALERLRNQRGVV